MEMLSSRCNSMYNLYVVVLNRTMASLQATSSHSAEKVEENVAKKPKKVPREFDWSLWNLRHVAFKVAYLGWSYSGLQIQKDNNDTIEAKLFEALTKTCMVHDYTSCNFSRSGRTDAGVSALTQVVALNVRSNLIEGLGVIVPDGSRAHERKGDKSKEIDYMFILNKVLPSDIRITAYSAVHPDFSARFNCLQRMYKYFFPLGTLNLDIMQEAAQKLIGDYDFRNFCKVHMDISGGVTNFKRRINAFNIKSLETNPNKSPYDMCEATISGGGFLWHQVRCMMGILFLIGSGLEKPEVIDDLLDLEKCPAKPNYGMAPDYPLILFDCIYEDVDWKTDEIGYKDVVSHFQQLWGKRMTETTMIRRMLDSLQLPLLLSANNGGERSVINDQNKELVSPGKAWIGRKGYKKLLTRDTGDTFEDRYAVHQAKKRKRQEMENDGSDSN